MTEPHLTDEELSAHLDGVPSRDAGHLGGCDRCASRLAELERAADAVRVAPPAPPDAKRAAIAAALSAAGPRGGAVGDIRPMRSNRRSVPPWVFAAAAVAALVLIAVPVLVAMNRTPSSRSPTAARAASGQESAASARSAGDLGDLADPIALRSAVGATLGASTADSAAATTSGASGAAGATPAPPAAAASPSSARSPQAGIITHPACDTAVRQSYGSGLGPLEVTATLRWQQTPSTLLVYALADSAGKPIRHRAFVMASGDCHLLVVQSL